LTTGPPIRADPVGKAAAEVEHAPLIRRALSSETDQLAELLWRVREQNAGSIPVSVHPLDAMRAWMRDVAFKEYEIWVAEASGSAEQAGGSAARDATSARTLVGLMALREPDWLEHLYVDREFTGRDIGACFLEVARRELSGSRIQLWTFQSNTGARRFYERHSFVAVQWTDGDNEEGAPDVRYQWVGPDRASVGADGDASSRRLSNLPQPHPRIP
jgi:GNAT superfamily N-acetyltransferase